MKKLALFSEQLDSSEMLKRLQTVTDYKRIHSQDVHRQNHLQKDKAELDDQKERRIQEIQFGKRKFIRKYHKYLFRNKNNCRKGSATERDDAEGLQTDKIKIEVHLPTVKLERENTFFSPDDIALSGSETDDDGSDGTPNQRSADRRRRRAKVMMVKPMSLSLPDINENTAFNWSRNSTESGFSGYERPPTPRKRSDSMGALTRSLPGSDQQVNHTDVPPFRDRSTSIAGLTRSHTQFPKIKEESPPFLRTRSQSFHTLGLLRKMDKNDFEKTALRRMSQANTGMLKFKYFAKLMTHSIKELKEELPDEEPKEDTPGLYKEMSACRYLRIPSEDV
jgi:hypothetical protein